MPALAPQSVGTVGIRWPICRPLWRVLVGLSIRHAGPTAAQALARAFSSMEAIEAAAEAAAGATAALGVAIPSAGNAAEDTPDEPVELIDGELIAVPRMRPPHASIVGRLGYVLQLRLGGEVLVRQRDAKLPGRYRAQDGHGHRLRHGGLSGAHSFNPPCVSPASLAHDEDWDDLKRERAVFAGIVIDWADRNDGSVGSGELAR